MDQQVKSAHEISEIMGKEYMESMFLGTHRFYVDIEFLIDFKLTAVLCMMSDIDYKIVQDNMKQYNARTDLETVKYFPGVSITEQDIDDFLANPTDLQAYAFRMQYTTYMEQFLDILRGKNNKNHLTSTDDDDFEVWVGCNGKRLPHVHRTHISERITEYVGNNVKIHITENGICEYSENITKGFQHFSIYDLEKVMAATSFNTHLSSGIYLGKTLNAYPLITAPNATAGGTLTAEEVLVGTINTLNWFFDFEYITTKVRHG